MCSALSDFQQVEGRVLKYRVQLCRVISAPNVLQWMPSFISGGDEREIKEIDNKSPEKAAFVFIDKILKCSELGKWKAFLEALEKADYPYLVSLLKPNGQVPENCEHQKKILQIFAPYLELQLEPCDIIMHLYASDLINARDVEEIKALQRNQGSVAATILMLDRLQRRQAPSRWYTDFLKILYQKGYKDIVREMEPDFTLDCEILKSPQIHVTDASDSDIEIDEFGCTIEEKIESKVRYFQSEIVELVKVEKIAPALCQLLSIERVCQIMQDSHTSQKESIESILEEISKIKNKTKWRSFVNILKQSDYPHLADLLSRPRTNKLQCKERVLLRLFHSTLGEQLDPVELITRLETDNAINHLDKEEIHNTLKKSGKTAASLVLIDCLQCRLAPSQWFNVFLNAIVASGREDIVQTIDPDYLENRLNGFDKPGDMVKECCFNDDLFPEDSYLVNKIDAAHCHVFKLGKSAKVELEKIQQRFDVMKSNLYDQIENKTITLSRALDHIDSLSERENEEEVNLEIERCLQRLMTTCFTLRASESFMNLDTLGVLQESKPPLHYGISGKGSSSTKNVTTLDSKTRIFSACQRQLSTDSSSSSQSSGYLVVDKNMCTSPASSNLDEVGKTKSVGKVTFADKNETAQEKREKTQTKLDQNRRSPQLSVQERDYLAYYSTRKISPGRRRTVSENSIMSTDGSGISSVDRPSSSPTDVLTESSTISSTTKTTNTPEKKVLLERTESYLYHHRIVVNCKTSCLFSSICVLPCNKTVLVDQSNSCFYVYEDTSKKLIGYRFNHHIPICVCNIGENFLFILFRRRDCTNILMQCGIHYCPTSNQKRIINGISFVKEVQISGDCNGKLCSVASSMNSVISVCSNKHVHVITTDGQELEIVICDIAENEWWPLYSRVDSDCKFVYLYDIYSCSVYGFCISTGQMIWKTKLPHVEGMTLCGESIYLALNAENKLEVLSRSTGELERIITENVRRPLAVSSSPGHDTIIVTQYHPRGNKINRTIKYF